MKGKVLWVEDGAFTDLTDYVGPLYMEGDYDLVVALDVSDALRQLERHEFVAVIIDIRLPPGQQRPWRDYYMKMGQNQISARLGLELLKFLLKPEKSKIMGQRLKLDWLDASRIGVFTMEGKEEIEPDLNELKIAVYQQKKGDIPGDTLLRLVEKITGAHPPRTI